MTNSGVNAGFAKCFIFFMAVVILVQGGAYLGLSIWGITLENCSNEIANITENPFEFAMDLIYFSNEKCGPRSVVIDGEPAIDIETDWAKSSKITNRMNIFLITYAAVSTLWVVLSLLVAATICGTVTKIAAACCFWPWFLVVLAGSILDVVATVYHTQDIIHTTSVIDTFDFVGVTVPDEVIAYLKNFDAYFVTPAVILTCLTSRVVLIWLLNIFGCGFCLSLSHILSKDSSSSTKRDLQQVQPQQTQLQPLPPQMKTVEYAQYPTQIEPRPLVVQVPLAEQRQNSVQSPISVYPPSVPSEVIVTNTVLTETNRQQPAVVSEMTTYRNTDTHPDKLDYPTQRSPEPRVPSPELSAISPLNTRYSGSDAFQNPNQNQPQRVSAELRSQLPWSYTSMLGKPQPPRKPQGKVYPEIPEPDYTMRQSRKERPSTPSGSDANSQQLYSRW